MRRFSTAVTITDPLVKYQSLLSAGVYCPDPAQHRLARHLRKVYLRIKDYSPQREYQQRLSQAARLTESSRPGEGSDNILAVPSHAIWRNPLFKHLLPNTETRDSVALTRVLQNHELAIEIDSPKGLFLSGEVGTGKSMLLDLLADGLPHQRKKRWHFNTFMLYTFAQLEKYRSANQQSALRRRNEEHSLLWMAKKLVDESPILFLDEFQLPDRAASKILSHLFIAFFQLGGVLIASSNRVPEDLEKATGVDYTNAPRLGIMRKFFGGGRAGSELYGQASDFSKLLEVLKARCDFWQMEGVQDWRRREDTGLQLEEAAGNLCDLTGSVAAKEDDAPKSADRPPSYFISGQGDENWPDYIKEKAFGSTPDIKWTSETLVVYGRTVVIPQHHKGTVFWDFEQLVGTFGPADYITMASSYHTFIIDNVPALSILQKNEARRFITFLDALYEARCKLVVRAERSPDHLFFPEPPKKPTSASGDTAEDGDATYSETIAEVYQDQMAPFRPNISYYDTKSATARYDPDQDSDFGLEKQQQQQQSGVNFGNVGAFTGEDERFAYKRAASRLWELCSARWHARTGCWWQPLPLEARHWEGGVAAQRPLDGPVLGGKQPTGESMGASVDADEVAGLSRYRIEHMKQSGDPEHR
ncbi:mitochondrial ATPase (Afg1) [Cordyceps militaris]|uniref:Mitochondrial ATPase (Afg1) n=1 Tax=Cordyceps militaris TaxID=73501 RepID=A0A2H4SFR2_CORMI|nr:mitochondrial ATPase (Afg1) [Cordyceps militaris]